MKFDQEINYRIVGKRQVQKNVMNESSSALFERGCDFNDNMHKIFNSNFLIKKGVYLFQTHEEANLHQDQLIINNIIRVSYKNEC